MRLLCLVFYFFFLLSVVVACSVFVGIGSLFREFCMLYNWVCHVTSKQSWKETNTQNTHWFIKINLWFWLRWTCYFHFTLLPFSWATCCLFPLSFEYNAAYCVDVDYLTWIHPLPFHHTNVKFSCKMKTARYRSTERKGTEVHHFQVAALCNE